MIAKVFCLNEMTKKYGVAFNSIYENASKVHIGDNLFKFPENDDRICFSKPDRKFFRKVAEENKMNMIKVVNNFQIVRKKKKGFSEIPLQESISGKKDLPHGRSANFEKFEYDDKCVV